MRNLSHRLSLVALACCVAGCAIMQGVQPVPATAPPSVCIIENPAVRPIFLATYRETLEALGYQVRVTSNVPPSDCPLTSTYTARWSWDIGMYMGYAKIDVFRGGEPIGQALYDVQMSASNDRFVDPAGKVQQLVSQLFPKREKFGPE